MSNDRLSTTNYPVTTTVTYPLRRRLTTKVTQQADSGAIGSVSSALTQRAIAGM